MSPQLVPIAFRTQAAYAQIKGGGSTKISEDPGREVDVRVLLGLQDTGTVKLPKAEAPSVPRCLFCDEPLGLGKRFKGMRFCSDEHEEGYHARQSEMAVLRLAETAKLLAKPPKRLWDPRNTQYCAGLQNLALAVNSGSESPVRGDQRILAVEAKPSLPAALETRSPLLAPSEQILPLEEPRILTAAGPETCLAPLAFPAMEILRPSSLDRTENAPRLPDDVEVPVSVVAKSVPFRYAAEESGSPIPWEQRITTPRGGASIPFLGELAIRDFEEEDFLQPPTDSGLLRCQKMQVPARMSWRLLMPRVHFRIARIYGKTAEPSLILKTLELPALTGSRPAVSPSLYMNCTVVETPQPPYGAPPPISRMTFPVHSLRAPAAVPQMVRENRSRDWMAGKGASPRMPDAPVERLASSPSFAICPHTGYPLASAQEHAAGERAIPMLAERAVVYPQPPGSVPVLWHPLRAAAARPGLAGLPIPAGTHSPVWQGSKHHAFSLPLVRCESNSAFRHSGVQPLQFPGTPASIVRPWNGAFVLMGASAVSLMPRIPVWGLNRPGVAGEAAPLVGPVSPLWNVASPPRRIAAFVGVCEAQIPLLSPGRLGQASLARGGISSPHTTSKGPGQHPPAAVAIFQIHPAVVRRPADSLALDSIGLLRASSDPVDLIEVTLPKVSTAPSWEASLGVCSLPRGLQDSPDHFTLRAHGIQPYTFREDAVPQAVFSREMPFILTGPAIGLEYRLSEVPFPVRLAQRGCCLLAIEPKTGFIARTGLLISFEDGSPKFPKALARTPGALAPLPALTGWCVANPPMEYRWERITRFHAVAVIGLPVGLAVRKEMGIPAALAAPSSRRCLALPSRTPGPVWHPSLRMQPVEPPGLSRPGLQGAGLRELAAAYALATSGQRPATAWNELSRDLRSMGLEGAMAWPPARLSAGATRPWNRLPADTYSLPAPVKVFAETRFPLILADAAHTEMAGAVPRRAALPALPGLSAIGMIRRAPQPGIWRPLSRRLFAPRNTKALRPIRLGSRPVHSSSIAPVAPDTVRPGVVWRTPSPESIAGIRAATGLSPEWQRLAGALSSWLAWRTGQETAAPLPPWSRTPIAIATPDRILYQETFHPTVRPLWHSAAGPVSTGICRALSEVRWAGELRPCFPLPVKTPSVSLRDMATIPVDRDIPAPARVHPKQIYHLRPGTVTGAAALNSGERVAALPAVYRTAWTKPPVARPAPERRLPEPPFLASARPYTTSSLQATGICLLRSSQLRLLVNPPLVNPWTGPAMHWQSGAFVLLPRSLQAPGTRGISCPASLTASEAVAAALSPVGAPRHTGWLAQFYVASGPICSPATVAPKPSPGIGRPGLAPMTLTEAAWSTSSPVLLFHSMGRESAALPGAAGVNAGQLRTAPLQTWSRDSIGLHRAKKLPTWRVTGPAPKRPRLSPAGATCPPFQTAEALRFTPLPMPAAIRCLAGPEWTMSVAQHRHPALDGIRKPAGLPRQGACPEFLHALSGGWDKGMVGLSVFHERLLATAAPAPLGIVDSPQMRPCSGRALPGQPWGLPYTWARHWHTAPDSILAPLPPLSGLHLPGAALTGYRAPFHGASVWIYSPVWVEAASRALTPPAIPSSVRKLALQERFALASRLTMPRVGLPVRAALVRLRSSRPLPAYPALQRWAPPECEVPAIYPASVFLAKAAPHRAKRDQEAHLPLALLLLPACVDADMAPLERTRRPGVSRGGRTIVLR